MAPWRDGKLGRQEWYAEFFAEPAPDANGPPDSKSRRRRTFNHEMPRDFDIGEFVKSGDQKKGSQNTMGSTTTSVPGIALNEDDSHYFFTRAGQNLNEAIVDSWVDQYADTQVRELFLCPNAMRTSYASNVWDPIWAGYDPEAGDDQPLFASTPAASRASVRGWVHTAWSLHAMGIDPYARWIARCRVVGISPWISMRMNDVHDVQDPESYIHSSFWREHPEFRRVSYRFSSWPDRAFDYGRAEVREHHMALIRELAERYDFDGFELDWMRFGLHFCPGHEASGRTILTDWIAEVRGLLNEWAARRGHPIKLGARVPTQPWTAWGLGMDAVEWARQHLVDMLVVTPFFPTTDTDIPVELWHNLLGSTGVTLAGGLELNLQPYPSYPDLQTHSLETARGTAASLLDRGVDRIYLFNFMDSQTAMADLSECPTVLREIGSLATLNGKRRRHIVTYADIRAPGEAAATALPADCAAGAEVAFRVHTGPCPTGVGGKVVLGLADAEPSAAGALTVRINGGLCGPAAPLELAKPRPQFPTVGFDVPEAALQRGYNLVEVHAVHDCRIGWVEVAVES